MKTWGLGRWGPLLAVLTLLVSAGVFAPGAQAAGKTVWGAVTDCVKPFAEFTGQVSLVEAHALFPPSSVPFNTASDGGYFSFTPSPGYYKLIVSPSGFTHFTTETTPFRFDGVGPSPSHTLCVDPMPPVGLNRNRTLTLSVLDAQSSGANDTITFTQTNRGPENVTVAPIEYDSAFRNVTLATAPLAWGTEKLVFTDATTGTGGVVLQRGPALDYDYTPQDAFVGKLHIYNATIQTELFNTLHPPMVPRGWLEVTYQNASTSARLSHGQIAWPPTFKKNGSPLLPTYNATLSLNLTTGVLKILAQDWRFGPDVLTASYFWSGALSG